ncbi:carboxylesterase/lipase family protein [Bordetella genomosp. 13]|uniref:carboxylesterase/lipase family protein n=1 Tax=Bordetella genomosp. 13 TaxID=463040 RepID=UPI0011A971D6|nr:carboxylesterase family protein [Bordetella genomosp. 13]
MTETVQIEVRQGALRGARQGEVCSFRAIPYATPPVGPLRFAPPRSAAAWQGVRDATRSGPIPPQLPSRLREAMGDFEAEQSEDCLHLTVWTPGIEPAARPVVVWLHGGAWQSGAGDLPWYDGARLAAQGDVVVVAVNYRLAALGWLYVPGETANVALLDMEAAVDWVMDNIAAFGGDASRVTLMGQSAGASSICAMLARQPRFSRAILQSASLGRGYRSARQAQALGDLVLRAAGARTLAQARELPFQNFLQAQRDPQVVAALQAEGSGRSLFGPVRDGDVLPDDVEPALRRAAGRADVLVAYTRDEMAAFPGADWDTVPAHSEQVFGAPGRQWAEWARQQGRQAWLARFDVAPTPRFGACHCIELPFVFGTLEAFADAPMLQGLDGQAARGLAQATQQAWLAFIRGQEPGGAAASWPAAPHVQALDAG